MIDAAAPRAISVVAAQRENQAHKIADVGRRSIGEGFKANNELEDPRSRNHIKH
jgi:hypothetical protein